MPRAACLEMRAENWAPHKGRTRHAPQARHRTGGTLATRPGPRTEQKGTLATRRDPRTARGTHLSRAAARAYAGDPRACRGHARGIRAAQGARAPRPARRAGTNTPYRAYCGFSIADCAAPSTELRKPQSDGEQMCAPARELAPCRRVQWFGTYPSRLREHHDR